MADHAALSGPSRRVTVIGATLAGLGLLGIAAYFAWPFLSAFSNPEEARRLVVDAGPWAPIVFIAMQVVQVVVAPIPGQVAGLVGGYVFGLFWGLAYTVVGATIGFTLVFILARKLGRPFVERVVNPKVLAKFDYLADSEPSPFCFSYFSSPRFPMTSLPSSPY